MKAKKNKITREPMDDEKIIELYFERDEKAIAETDFKYRKYLFSVAYNMLHDKFECEECLSDTYLGVWNAIPPSRPNVLKAFLTTIVRRIAIKRYNRTLRKKVISSEMTVSLSEIEDFISDNSDIDTDFDAKELGRVISNFVRSQSERRQFIFISRYYIAEPIDKIARDLSLSRSTVNKELAAVREALKEKLESEGYSV